MSPFEQKLIELVADGGVNGASLIKWYVVLNSPLAYAAAWIIVLPVLYLTGKKMAVVLAGLGDKSN